MHLPGQQDTEWDQGWVWEPAHVSGLGGWSLLPLCVPMFRGTKVPNTPRVAPLLWGEAGRNPAQTPPQGGLCQVLSGKFGDSCDTSQRDCHLSSGVLDTSSGGLTSASIETAMKQ